MQQCPVILSLGLKVLKLIHAPVYKPAGLCSARLMEGFKMDLYNVLEHHGFKVAVPLKVAISNQLEPFASGLVTFVASVRDVEKRKNFILADSTYEMIVEFGVERLHHSIDGTVIGKASIDQVNEQKIRELLPTSEGIMHQGRLPKYRLGQDIDVDPLRLLKEPNMPDEMGLNATEILNQITLPMKLTKPKNPKQKYPYIAPSRLIRFKGIELLDYREPYGTFRIIADGGFNPRRFMIDLADQLGTKASMVSLIRLREGPLAFDDQLVLQIHELQLDNYAHRLPIYSRIYDEFHAKLGPLWENIEL